MSLLGFGQTHMCGAMTPETLDDLHRLLATVRVKLTTACGLTVRQCAPRKKTPFNGSFNCGSILKIFACAHTQFEARKSANKRNKQARQLCVRLRAMAKSVTEKEVRMSELKELQDLYDQVSANTTQIKYLQHWMELEAISVHETLMSEHASDVWRDLPVIDRGFDEMQF